MAADIVRLLVAREITVASGLTRGIEATAHRATLDARWSHGRSDRHRHQHAVPRENWALQEDLTTRAPALMVAADQLLGGFSTLDGNMPGKPMRSAVDEIASRRYGRATSAAEVAPNFSM
jgi:hypothetical protein